jgi:YfiH family protein
MTDPGWLRPEAAWPGAQAWMTTRPGGVSRAPFDSLNLGGHVGDEPSAVAKNARRVAEACGITPVWLAQVHGTRVVRLTAADGAPGAAVHRADASITTEPGLACAVLVADCLPVLFAAPGGRAVGAAHAGWRGLAGGVLEATVAAVCAAGDCEPRELTAWLGACIGPENFEVGADVLQAFGALPGATGPRFIPGAPGKWLADLPGLANDCLRGAGLADISGGTWCTVRDPSRFFSYRRDRVTGRMAALVWIGRH